jgi:hypothetical protein
MPGFGIPACEYTVPVMLGLLLVQHGLLGEDITVQGIANLLLTKQMRMLKSHGKGYVCMQIDTKEQVQYYILTGMLKLEMVGVSGKGPILEVM